MRLSLVWKLNSLLLKENKNIFLLRFLSIGLILGVSCALYGLDAIWPKSSEQDLTVYTFAFLLMNEVIWLKKTVTFGSFRHSLAWLSIPLSFRERFLLNLMQFFTSYFLVAFISVSVLFDGDIFNPFFYTFFFIICYSYPKNFRIIDQKSPELNKNVNPIMVLATSILKFIIVYCYSFLVLILFVFTLQTIEKKAGLNYAALIILTLICLPLLYSLKTNDWLRISEHKRFLLTGRASFSLLKRQLMALTAQTASIAVLIVGITWGLTKFTPKLSKSEQIKESDFKSLVVKKNIPAIKAKFFEASKSDLLVKKYIRVLARHGDAKLINQVLAKDLESLRDGFLKVSRKSKDNKLYLNLVVNSVKPLSRYQYDRGLQLAIDSCDEKAFLKIFEKTGKKMTQKSGLAGNKNSKCQRAISSANASGSTENLL